MTMPATAAAVEVTLLSAPADGIAPAALVSVRPPRGYGTPAQARRARAVWWSWWAQGGQPIGGGGRWGGSGRGGGGYITAWHDRHGGGYGGAFRRATAAAAGWVRALGGGLRRRRSVTGPPRAVRALCGGVSGAGGWGACVCVSWFPGRVCGAGGDCDVRPLAPPHPTLHTPAHTGWGGERGGGGGGCPPLPPLVLPWPPVWCHLRICGSDQQRLVRPQPDPHPPPSPPDPHTHTPVTCACAQPQYLINAPEGFARLVLEHRARPGPGLRALLLTSLTPDAAVSRWVGAWVGWVKAGEGHRWPARPDSLAARLPCRASSSSSSVTTQAGPAGPAPAQRARVDDALAGELGAGAGPGRTRRTRDACAAPRHRSRCTAVPWRADAAAADT